MVNAAIDVMFDAGACGMTEQRLIIQIFAVSNTGDQQVRCTGSSVLLSQTDIAATERLGLDASAPRAVGELGFA